MTVATKFTPRKTRTFIMASWTQIIFGADFAATVALISSRRASKSW